MSYTTLRKNGEYTLIEKKSEFIAKAVRITSEEEALALIAEIRKELHGARHHVYAYTLGRNSELKRYSDDGEPKGTGGMPVLNVIERNSLKDVLIIVSRIFGGILLGAHGLTRAYGGAAAEAVKNAEKAEVVSGSIVEMRLPYDVHGRLAGQFEKDSLQITGETYLEDVRVSVLLKSEDVEGFMKRYTDLTQGRGEFTEIVSGEDYFLGEDGTLSEIQ